MKIEMFVLPENNQYYFSIKKVKCRGDVGADKTILIIKDDRFVTTMNLRRISKYFTEQGIQI